MTVRPPQSPLSGQTLVYVAPRDGGSGVGDYATEFVAAARPYFRDIVEIRHPGAGGDRFTDVRRARAHIAEVLGERGVDRTIVHGELSGGSLVPFWSLPTDPAIRVTMTMHDPPRPIWYPFRNAPVARIRVAPHLAQMPFDRIVRRYEFSRIRGRSIFVLSKMGAATISGQLPGNRVIATTLPIPQRREVAPVGERPLAVGMFGHVYRGKGFHLLPQLRRLIDPAIEIRVAGRGTESLPEISGVRVLGPVEGAAEDKFFASTRMLLIPYAVRRSYGGLQVPASAAAARGIAYLTPVVGYGGGTLDELSNSGVAMTVAPDVRQLAECVNSVAEMTERLEAMAQAARMLQERCSPQRIIADFVCEWAR